MGCASRRPAFPVAAFLLLCCAGGAAGEPNPAAAVAARAGHPALRHVRAEATRTRDGITETVTLESSETRRIVRVCAGDLCRGSWFDGARRFLFGINGTPLPDRDTDAASERTFAAIESTEFAEPDFRAAGGTVTALATAPDGRLRYRVVAPGGHELVAVVDARTARLEAAERPDGTPYRELFATSDGTTTIFAGQIYDRIAVVSGALEAPRGPAVTLGATPPLVLEDADLPIVGCSLGGVAAHCLLDSGSTPSAVTLAFAERVGQEPRGEIEIAALGSYLTGAVDIGPLALGGAEFDHLHFAVIPHLRGPAFDAVIGCDILARLRVRFDIAARRAQIVGDDPAAAAPIAVAFTDGLPYIDVSLGAQARDDSMLVDTGDSEPLSIGYDEYRRDPTLFDPLGGSTAAGMSPAVMDTVEGTLARVAIGDITFEHVAISAVRGQHVGHVGYGLAARCRPFTLDLGRERIECGTADSGGHRDQR